ncbi:hypothetical protein VTL71DRAFT_9748 [Oculimacula yallundae]|uniref:NACHT domain-containing protein n=1 Tax=Oculimacula yallundae TaxID=86028 RepID=A0ABR4BUJ1_9HELO
MEGLAAFGIVVNVIQLVDFTSKLVAGGHEIYKSADGQLVEHSEIQKITVRLSTASKKVADDLSSLKSKRSLTSSEQELVQLGHECVEIATELHDALEKLKVGGKVGKRQSFRQALLTVWHKDKIEGLEKRLDRFRQQLVTEILDMLRVEAREANEKQASVLNKVDQVEHSTRTLGNNLLQHIDDSKRWKDDLIEAFHKAPPSIYNGYEAVEYQEKLQEQFRSTLLNRLRFSGIREREERIAEAEEQTFEWIYCDPEISSKPWTSFIAWLGDPDSALYWITGKAGAGKSTLMKYLHRDRRTLHFLEKWVQGSNLVTAAFFFWNSGTSMQMSMIGLLQSLLYQLLTPLRSSAVKAFPQRWEEFNLFGEDMSPWSWEELSRALKLLVSQIHANDKFFIMIDGLDEFDGIHAELIDLIVDLAKSTKNLKVCAASRPWASFEDAFKGRPSLMIQDLTAPDIQLYVYTHFRENIGFNELEERDPEYAKKLLNEVAAKSDGVFLWVHLVVRSLLSGLTNGDRLSDLQSRLDALPQDLKVLFRKILDHLEPMYLEDASKLFQLVRAAISPPSLLSLSLAEEDDPNIVFRAETKPRTNRELLSISKHMRRRLNSRCKGLLEVPTRTRDQDLIKFEEREIDEPAYANFHDPGRSMARMQVQYLHRTVKDFLESPDIWAWVIEWGPKDFQPGTSLARSSLLELKGMDPNLLTVDRFSDVVLLCIGYAADHFGMAGEYQARYLDELDNTAITLSLRPSIDGYNYLQNFGDRQEDVPRHWSSSIMREGITETTFFYLVAMFNFHHYLESKLTPDYIQSQSLDLTPLLVAAVSDYELMGRSLVERYCDQAVPHMATVRVLLTQGANPNLFYHGRRTPREIARNKEGREWEQIRELFTQYDADFKQKRDFDASIKQKDGKKLSRLGKAVKKYLTNYI